MRIILVGFGVVGQAFARLTHLQRKELMSRFGLNPRIVAVVDSGGYAFNLKGLEIESLLTAKSKSGTVASLGESSADALHVIKDIEAEVLVEATPTDVNTGQPGMSHIESAFAAGKHVITVNKGPLGLALPALTELALHNNVQFLFSGCVGGGTPVLDFGKRCLAVDRILEIHGVLNGTTNFILSKMESEPLDFDDALKEAQKLGYAEADPTLDVDGWDTAIKTVIMANWLMGKEITIKDVDARGIRNITQKDLKNAADDRKRIRLIGSIDNKITIGPRLISENDPLCVSGTLNAVQFKSEFAGDEIIVGKGSGGLETASAILRDLLTVRNHLVS